MEIPFARLIGLIQQFGGGVLSSITSAVSVGNGGSVTPTGTGTVTATTLTTADNVSAGTLASARGGTGVSNAGTITNASNTTITGGGTLALGGFIATVSGTGTLVKEMDVYNSPVDFNAAATAGSTGAGSFTVGNSYFFYAAATITGIRIYYPDTTSRSLRFRIWDNTNTSVYNEDHTYNTVGVKTLTLATPYSASAYKKYTVSIWDTSGGAYFFKTRTGTGGLVIGGQQLNRWCNIMAIGNNVAGDAFPSGLNGNEMYPVEPVITVP